MLASPSIDEQPILWLGLSGFDGDVHSALERAASRCPGAARWRLAPFADADAWLLNGSRLQVLESGELRVRPGQIGEPAVRLDPADVQRPLAFAAPLPDGLEPALSFQPHSEASVHRVLLQLEHCLRLRRSQIALGLEMLRRRATLEQAVYHVSRGGSLLAVIDLTSGHGGLNRSSHRPNASAPNGKRPAAAADVPSTFEQVTAHQLLWAYVQAGHVSVDSRIVDVIVNPRRADESRRPAAGGRNGRSRLGPPGPRPRSFRRVGANAHDRRDMPVPGNSLALCRRWKAPNNLSTYAMSKPESLSRTKNRAALRGRSSRRNGWKRQPHVP